MQWRIRNRELLLGSRCLVMGIVNVTPDSFSDGGRYLHIDSAIAHGLELERQGADLLDIGGESTRPGSQPISCEEELLRVVPVVTALAQKTHVPISIDTSKAEVARACLEAGAHIVNDVTGLGGDPRMVGVVRDFGAGAIVMHMQGTPATMQIAPHYGNVTSDLFRFFAERLQSLAAAGIAPEAIALDPGIGFGKTARAQHRPLEPTRGVHRARPTDLSGRVAQGLPWQAAQPPGRGTPGRIPGCRGVWAVAERGADSPRSRCGPDARSCHGVGITEEITSLP